jgi:hypothetical protein
MNNRLDFISKFKDEDIAILEMTGCRAKFIELDEALRIEAQLAQDNNLPAMARSIANARTRLEEACQHAIKALCIKHEDVS